MEFKDDFPKEYHSLTGATVNEQIKRGYLLDAHSMRRGGVGMADTRPAKRGPDGDKGTNQRGRHSQPQPSGTAAPIPTNS